LKIEQNALENRQLEITVEVPGEMLAAAMQKTARHLSKQVKIPGFRPGKAPYDIILHRLGEDTVFEEALESLGQEVYSKALEEAEINPVSIGSFNDIVSREPLVLKYTVPLQPLVELGKYEKIRIPFSEPELEEGREQEILDMLRQSRAVIEPVERPAALEDLVVVDLHGSLVPDASAEEESEEDLHLTHEHGITLLVSEESDFPFKGIHKHLIGLESGQEKDIEYTFPKDYETEQLRKRKATFTVKCLDVKSRELPELTDELAAGLGEFENLEEMKSRIRTDMLETERRKALDEYNREVIGRIVEGADILYPPVLLEEEIDEMLQEVDRNLKQRSFSLAEQLKLENKSLQDFRKEIEPDAEMRLKRSLVLGKALDLQQVEVEPEEIEAEINNIRAQFPKPTREIENLLNHPAQRQRILMDLLTQKTIERLSLIARGEYKPEAEAGEGKKPGAKKAAAEGGKPAAKKTPAKAKEPASKSAEVEKKSAAKKKEPAEVKPAAAKKVSAGKEAVAKAEKPAGKKTAAKAGEPAGKKPSAEKKPAPKKKAAGDESAAKDASPGTEG